MVRPVRMHVQAFKQRVQKTAAHGPRDWLSAQAQTLGLGCDNSHKWCFVLTKCSARRAGNTIESWLSHSETIIVYLLDTESRTPELGLLTSLHSNM
jgi:hypothetical protein